MPTNHTNFPKGMSQPSLRALESAGIHSLQDLTRFAEDEVAKLHGMGPKALGILREALLEQGKSFAKSTPPLAKKLASPNKKRSSDSAIEFIRQLEHPLKEEINTVRKWILDVDPSIQEDIKWKSPSFKTTDFFCTFHLRSQTNVQLVLHLGAKVKPTAKSGIEVADPEGLLKWLAKDRAMLDLGSGATRSKRKQAAQNIVREWIRWL